MKLVDAAPVGKRWCPLCGLSTDERTCPKDHVATLIRGATTASLNTLKPGTMVAQRFRIDELLGRGGFAAVFRATQLTTGQPIALKVLESLQLADNEQLMRRFFTEARATAGLRHPNTVRVYDFGQDDDGLLFIAMELLTGRTLKQELGQRRKQGQFFAESEAVEIGVAVTHSLSEAHHAGLVHRDLKPDNIFLHQVEGAEPTIKVVDFGIVKLAGSNLTQENNVSTLGTPTYMSPEQALGAQDVDPRSDIYSLATVLYELVSGDAPFRSANWQATLIRQIKEPPKDLRTVAQVPISEGFAAAIHRALSKEPGERFGTVHEFRKALLGGSAAYVPTPAASMPTRPEALPQDSRKASSVAKAPAKSAEPSWMLPTATPPSESNDLEGLSLSLPTSDTGTMPRTDFTSVHAQGHGPQIGALVDNRYQLDEVLADGREGLVFRGRRLSDTIPVVLLIRKSGTHLDALFQLHRRVVSSAVAASLERFSTQFGPVRHEVFVRHFLDGFSLTETARTRAFQEREVIEVLIRLCSTLVELSRLTPPVLHGALSPDHVIVRPSGQMALVGFAPDRPQSASQDMQALAGIGVALLGGDPGASPDVWRDNLPAHPATRNLLRGLVTPGVRDAAEALLRLERVRDTLPRHAVNHPAPQAPAPVSSARAPGGQVLTRDQLESIKERTLQNSAVPKTPLWIAIGVASAAALGVAGIFLAKPSGPAAPGIEVLDAVQNLIPTLNFCAAGASGTELRLSLVVFEDGSVDQIGAQTEGRATGDAVSCAENAAANWKFSPFPNGFITMALPISLSSAGATMNPHKVPQVRHYAVEWYAPSTTEGIDYTPYVKALNADIQGVVDCISEAATRLVIPREAQYNATIRVASDGSLTTRLAGVAGGGDSSWVSSQQLSLCMMSALGEVRVPSPPSSLDIAIVLNVSQTPIQHP